MLTAAVAEERAFAPERPTTTATQDGDGYRLTGSKAIVPGGSLRRRVPGAGGDRRPAWASSSCCPATPGVTVTEQTFSDRDAVARVDLDDVRAGRRPRWSDPPTARWTGGSGTCCCWPARPSSSGSARARSTLTASYAKTREQFGRPIGTFQAVSQRLADGYIDTLAQRLALWQAAWRMDEGLPADTEVAIAKLWAADAGHRIAHTTVHVHGGVGIDLDGEAHRYFTSAKRYEFLHGGATEQALHIGRTLAAEPA